MDNETLQAMRELLAEERQHTRQLIQEELKPIKADLEQVKEDISELKHDMKEVKGSVASVVDWIDEAEHAVEIRFPVRKKA